MPISDEEVLQARAALAAEQSAQTILLAAYVVTTALMAVFLFQYMFVLFVLFGPALLVCAWQTCPSNNSFDAKKELKKVMRGDNDPNQKPAGMFERTFRNARANVGAELAAFAGYQQTMANFSGVFSVATLRLPAMDTDCFWLGAFGKWTFLFSREIPTD